MLSSGLRNGHIAACLAQNTHAIVLLDQAGWHGEKALALPVGRSHPQHQKRAYSSSS